MNETPQLVGVTFIPNWTQFQLIPIKILRLFEEFYKLILDTYIENIHMAKESQPSFKAEQIKRLVLTEIKIALFHAVISLQLK